MTSNAGGKVAPDWERIESDYRAGVLSVREIAGSNGVSHTAINKKAKDKGWVRDLSVKIQAKADSLVSSAEVSTEVSTGNAVNERVIIESNALAIANVRLAHRGDIRRFRNLAIKLLEELESMTEDNTLFTELGEMLRQESDSGVDRLNDLYKKVIDFPSRTSSLKLLSDTLKTLIGLEREAYGINKGVTEENNTPAGLGHMYGRSNT